MSSLLRRRGPCCWNLLYSGPQDPGRKDTPARKQGLRSSAKCMDPWPITCSVAHTSRGYVFIKRLQNGLGICAMHPSIWISFSPCSKAKCRPPTSHLPPSPLRSSLSTTVGQSAKHRVSNRELMDDQGWCSIPRPVSLALLLCKMEL